MQRPDDALAALQDAGDAVQRQHALVYPVQVDDVCLLELLGAGDVDAHIGNVCLPQTRPPESAAWQDGQAFQELRYLVAYPANRNGVGLLVAHHELRLHAVGIESIQKTTGCNGTSTATFTCTYEQHLHAFFTFLFFYFFTFLLFHLFTFSMISLFPQPFVDAGTDGF